MKQVHAYGVDGCKVGWLYARISEGGVGIGTVARLCDLVQIVPSGSRISESKRLSGKGLSKQTYNITPKILEVDQLMNSHAKAREMIREVHPEVCFYGLAGCRPMRHGKKTKEGFAERLTLLVSLQPGIENVVETTLARYPRKMVAPDDILDALVCAVTASMAEHWNTVPSVPEIDSKGLPMEMVYCGH